LKNIIYNLYKNKLRGTKVPPETQGTYGSPETPPLNRGT